MPNSWTVSLIVGVDAGLIKAIFPVQNMIQTQVGGNKHNIAFFMYDYKLHVHTDTQMCTAKELPQSGLGAAGDLLISSICKLAPGLLSR